MVKLTEDMVIARSRISDLTAVKRLNCWGSELTDISILRDLKKVEVLSLSVNNIDTLADFQYCYNLKDLFIRKNNITDLNEVCYLQNLENLRNLWLGENPCAEREGYRLAVLRALPGLEKLDDKFVTSEELNLAMSRGKILVHPEMDARVQSTPASPEEIVEDNDEGESERSHCYSSSSDQRSYDENQYDRDRRNANYDASPQYAQNNHYNYENGRDRSQTVDEEMPKIESRSNGEALTNIKTLDIKDNDERPARVMRQNSDSEDNRGFGEYERSEVINQRSQVAISPKSTYSAVEYSDLREFGERNNCSYDDRRQHVYEEAPQGLRRASSYSHQNLEREDHGRDAPGWARHSEKDKCRFHYPRRPVTRNSNILSAVLCLVKELDYPSLEVVEIAVRNRMDELLE